MRLEAAHRILIGAAAGLFLFFAGLETVRWWRGEGARALGQAAAGLAAAVLFLLYLRWFLRRGRL